jgi:hypothetical protein
MKQIFTAVFCVLFIYGSISPLLAQWASESAGGEDDPYVLFANPGPPNNGGSANWAIFFNLIADPSYYVTITHMTTASTATAGASFTVEFFTRQGNALGGPVGSGPGSSPAGWTSLGIFPVTQGSVSSGVSELFATPAIVTNPSDTTGVAIQFFTVGPRYYGTGTPPYGVYTNTGLTLVTGDARSAPFTPSGSWFASRELVGEIHYDAVVPVELVSFTASVIHSNNIELRWITATELNNSGFYIERKTESTEWENVGFVQGYGTTTQTQVYSFVDKDLKPGSYSYRLKQTDFDGSFRYYELSETVEIGAVQNFYLSQNYPNPFNPSTTISYKLPAESHVSLKVYDVLGNVVATLVNDTMPAGEYNNVFNASGMSSGIYFYTLQAGSFVETKSMILMK